MGEKECSVQHKNAVTLCVNSNSILQQKCGDDIHINVMVILNKFGIFVFEMFSETLPPMMRYVSFIKFIRKTCYFQNKFRFGLHLILTLFIVFL